MSENYDSEEEKTIKVYIAGNGGFGVHNFIESIQELKIQSFQDEIEAVVKEEPKLLDIIDLVDRELYTKKQKKTNAWNKNKFYE